MSRHLDGPDVTGREQLNLILRVAMECGVVAALAYWGVRAGDSTPMKVVLGVGAPAIGFGFWGAVDFHQAGRFAELARLTQELAVSGLAALAAYAAGQHTLGIGLASLSGVYHALVYASGARLLKPRAGAPDAARASTAGGGFS